MRTLMTSALAVVLVAGAAVAADAVFFSSDGERFDLSELNDGETRIFEAGEKELTATREGDIVTLLLDEGRRSTCNLEHATCVVTTAGDRIMISKEISHECHGEDCPQVVIADDLGGIPGGAQVLIERIACDGDDCEAHAHASAGSMRQIIVRRDCDGDDCNSFEHADGNVTVDIVGTGAGRHMMLAPGGLLSMRWKEADDRDGCPEGTREMRYVDESADDGYLCVGAPHADGEHGVFVVSPGDDIDWVQQH